MISALKWFRETSEFYGQRGPLLVIGWMLISSGMANLAANIIVMIIFGIDENDSWQPGVAHFILYVLFNPPAFWIVDKILRKNLPWYLK